MRMKENLQRSFLVGQSRELWRSHFQLRESIEVLSLLLEIIIVSQLAASHETAVPGVDGVDLSSCGAECAVKLQTKVREDFTIMEKTPPGVFSRLKALSHLIHYA